MVIRRLLLGAIVSVLLVTSCAGGDQYQDEVARDIIGTLPHPDSGAPTDTTIAEREQLHQCDRRAEQAQVRYEPSRDMTIGTTEQYLVTASLDTADETTGGDGFSGPTTAAQVPLRCEVQAQLRSTDFDIDPTGFQPGSFLDQPTITWSWDLVPLKVGPDQKLSLEIRSVAVIDGRRIEGAGSRLFSPVINVNVKAESFGETLKRWSSAFVQHPLVAGAGSLATIAGVMAGVWRWLLKRRWPWNNKAGEQRRRGSRLKHAGARKRRR